MLIVNAPAYLYESFQIELKINKIIHVGANTGQEVEHYDRSGIEGFHIEAHPEYYKELFRRCALSEKQIPIQACCDGVVGNIVEFNVTTNKQSSSMLPLGRHAHAYPNITVSDKIRLETDTIDNLVRNERIPSDAEVMLIDVQGAEDRVLSGATELLKSGKLWGLQVETALDELYEGERSIEQIYSEFIKPAGYFLKHADFNRHGWTNAIFLKRWWRLPGEDVSPLQMASGYHGISALQGRNIGPDGRCSQSSLSRWSRGADEARRAVDGAPIGSFTFHTHQEANSWWMIEWDEPQKIDQIVLFNREAQFAVMSRIKGAIIEYTLDGINWIHRHTIDRVYGGAAGTPMMLDGKLTAKAVRVRQPNNQALHFDHIRFQQV